jgi:hypothetical protein
MTMIEFISIMLIDFTNCILTITSLDHNLLLALLPLLSYRSLVTKASNDNDDADLTGESESDE